MKYAFNCCLMHLFAFQDEYLIYKIINNLDKMNQLILVTHEIQRCISELHILQAKQNSDEFLPEKTEISAKTIKLTNTVVDYDVLKYQSDRRFIRQIFNDEVQLNGTTTLSEILLDLDQLNNPLSIIIPKTSRSLRITNKPLNWNDAYLNIIIDPNSTIHTILEKINKNTFEFKLKCTVPREYTAEERVYTDTSFYKKTEDIYLIATI